MPRLPGGAVAPSHSGSGGFSWLVSWLFVTGGGTWLFAVLYIGAASAPRVWSGQESLAEALLPLLVFPVLVVLPMAFPVIVLPMTAIAAGLRWLWRRGAPARWREATAPAVLGGALAGLLGMQALLLVRAAAGGFEGVGLAQLATAGTVRDLAFTVPMVLGGAAAGYLAHLRLSPRSCRWWAVVAAAAVAGLVLVAPYDPTLR